jgi:uncharacterized membrane protein YeaQ/YmgE (transglycosylase-associated protein family)
MIAHLLDGARSVKRAILNKVCRTNLLSPILGFNREIVVSNILWIIVIGFIAGVIARVLWSGPNNPSGFILTTVLGICGAFLSTFIGQTIGWYRLDQGAGRIGATVGALLVLFIWNRLVAHRVLSDPSNPAGPGAPPRRWL